MAVHTYNIDNITGVPQDADVLVTVTGTSGGLNFSIQFLQSQVIGMTVAQLKTFAKNLIDAQLFPVAPTLNPALAGFAGSSFTQ